MLKRFSIFLGLIWLGNIVQLHAQNSEELLNTWTLLDYKESAVAEVKMPNSVQSIVSKKEEFKRFSNEYESQMAALEDKMWYFETTIDLSENQLQSKQIWLSIEELDANAKVFLNGNLIGEHHTPFVPFERDLKQYKLETGKNTIRIWCMSWLDLGKTLLDETELMFPADNDQTEHKISPVLRKPTYQFGWDFAPKHITTGIHTVPKLIFVEQARIESCKINMNTLSAVKSQLSAEIQMSHQGPYDVKIENLTENEISGEGKIGHQKGVVDFEVVLPKKWWPKGMGAPNLYTFKITVSQDKKVVDTRTITTGLREAELVQAADDFGTSFYFKVNGYQTFARGVNYVPMDVDLSQVTSADYETFFNKLKTTGINMIRVWGGGTYEREDFYTHCDQLGIMVWQDFMFANTTYPDQDWFYESIRTEATYQTKRLAHHPCMIHWNGNNEIDVAWKNWGWQSTYKMNGKTKKRMMTAYENIFKDILPEAVKNNSTSSYTHSSPLSNWGPNGDLKSGSLHYWGVWHGKENMDAYANNVGRFVSEYGFQSYPSDNVLKLYDPGFDGDYQGLQGRQKSYIGNDEIDRQMTHYFGTVAPNNKAYVSQLLQALAMEKAILAHRMKKPQCAGTLMWQGNDCWPGASWSALDCHHNPKAVFGTMQELMNPIQIIEEVHPDFLVLFAVNDSTKNASAKLEVNFYDFDGKLIGTVKETVNLNKATANVLASIPLGTSLKGKTPQEIYAVAALSNSIGVLNERVILFDDPKNLKLKNPSDELNYFVEDGVEMVKSSTFVYAPQFLDTIKETDKMGNEVTLVSGLHMLPGKAYPVKKSAEFKFYLPTP